MRTSFVPFFVLAALSPAQERRELPAAEIMYQQSCAACHDAAVGRAPQRSLLRAMSPEHVLDAMESGPMTYMAARWPQAGRRAIAEFITGKTLGAGPAATTLSPSAMCPPGSGDFANPLSGPRWNGWGVNTSNTRFQ